MNNIMKNLEEIVSGLFLVATVIVVILNVILRYVFNTGFYWVEEVATTCFIWSVFIGVSAAYKHKMHIGIDMITTLMPKNAQVYVSLVINSLMILINGYIFYLSVVFTRASAIKPTAVLGISSSWVSGSILVGFALVTFHACRFFIHDIMVIKNRNVVEDAQ